MINMIQIDNNNWVSECGKWKIYPSEQSVFTLYYDDSDGIADQETMNYMCNFLKECLIGTGKYESVEGGFMLKRVDK